MPRGRSRLLLAWLVLLAPAASLVAVIAIIARSKPVPPLTTSRLEIVAAVLTPLALISAGSGIGRSARAERDVEQHPDAMLRLASPLRLGVACFGAFSLIRRLHGSAGENHWQAC
jgi:hypothetical protein